MQEPESLPGSVVLVINRHFAEARLARICELAASGRCLEAEALLQPGGHLPTDAAELDLLARLATQQRKYARACQLWRAALQISPENEQYKQLLIRARTINRTLETAKQLIVAISIAVVLALLLLYVLNSLSGVSSKSEHPHETPRPVEKQTVGSNSP